MPAILDPALALRSAILLIVSLALLVAGEVFIEKRYPKKAPLWTLVMLVPMMATFFASVAAGSVAGAWIGYALLPQNLTAVLTGALLGGLAGLRYIALVKQVLGNLLRKRVGLKPQKIQLWWKPGSS